MGAESTKRPALGGQDHPKKRRCLDAIDEDADKRSAPRQGQDLPVLGDPRQGLTQRPRHLPELRSALQKPRHGGREEVKSRHGLSSRSTKK